MVTGELFSLLFLADKLCNKANDNNQDCNIKQPVDQPSGKAKHHAQYPSDDDQDCDTVN